MLRRTRNEQRKDAAGKAETMKRCPGTRWTRERLLGALRLEAQRIGRTPTMRDLISPDCLCAHWSTYFRWFGNLSTAQREAGLTPNDKGSARRMWTRASAIAQLKRQARELGRTPFYTEIAVDRHVLQRLFGTIGNAFDAAGLRRRRRGGWYARMGPDILARHERAVELAECWSLPRPVTVRVLASSCPDRTKVVRSSTFSAPQDSPLP